MTYVIYRTLTGVTLFKGILTQKARVKLLTASDQPKYANQIKAKFTAMVTAKKSEENAEENQQKQQNFKFAEEHCIVRFINPDHRENFIKVFKECSSTSN